MSSDIKTYDIAVLPGDGIGTEVMPPALGMLEAVGRRHGLSFRWTEHDWSCDRYLKTGATMPKDAIEQVRGKDAILLGAVGNADSASARVETLRLPASCTPAAGRPHPPGEPRTWRHRLPRRPRERRGRIFSG